MTPPDRPLLHQARNQPWKAEELKAHLAAIVDYRTDDQGICSVLDVMLELLGGELQTFLLFGRLGHLDPPRPDGKIAWACLRRLSEDPVVNEKLTEAVRGWIAKSQPGACAHGWVRYVMDDSAASHAQKDDVDAVGRPYRDLPMWPVAAFHYAKLIGSDFAARVLTQTCVDCGVVIDVGMAHLADPMLRPRGD